MKQKPTPKNTQKKEHKPTFKINRENQLYPQLRKYYKRESKKQDKEHRWELCINGIPDHAKTK